MDLFWTHQDNIQKGLGFGQFSPAHFLLILLSFILIVFIIIKYKKSDSGSRLMMRRQIAVFLMVLEAVKLVVMAVTGARVSNNLPLEICSFGEYAIVLDAFLKNNKFLSKMLLYLFLPAALMSIVFPTTTILPVFNFFTIHQFLFHALIIAYALMRFVAKETETDYLSVWQSIAAISMIAMAVYVIDRVFDHNFMFLMDTYDNFMLNKIWNIAGGRLMYDLGLVIFSMIVIHIFYFIFAGINKQFIRRITV